MDLTLINDALERVITILRTSTGPDIQSQAISISNMLILLMAVTFLIAVIISVVIVVMVIRKAFEALHDIIERDDFFSQFIHFVGCIVIGCMAIILIACTVAIVVSVYS